MQTLNRKSTQTDNLPCCCKPTKSPTSTFWESVATNLDPRRLRSVRGRRNPRPSRVVEFLNAQMPHIEVLAVEIKQFRGESLQTLVPRVIGRTAEWKVRQRWDQPASKADPGIVPGGIPSEEARRCAERILDVARVSGATLWWGSNVSIRMDMLSTISSYGCSS